MGTRRSWRLTMTCCTSLHRGLGTAQRLTAPRDLALARKIRKALDICWPGRHIMSMLILASCALRGNRKKRPAKRCVVLFDLHHPLPQTCHRQGRLYELDPNDPAIGPRTHHEQESHYQPLCVPCRSV